MDPKRQFPSRIPRSVAALLFVATTAATEASPAPREFLTGYCASCHGTETQEAGLTLHDLPLRFSTDEQLQRWRMIYDRVRFGEMPPEMSAQPPQATRKKFLSWIRQGLLESQRAGSLMSPKRTRPESGNLVDHEELFRAPAAPVTPGPPRLWRVRPEIYLADLRRIAGPMPGLSQPLAVQGHSDFRDYAAFDFIDEPATDQLLGNARQVVEQQAAGERHPAIAAAMHPSQTPTEAMLTAALTQQFQATLHRPPRAAELDRLRNSWRTNLAASGHPAGTRAALMAVLFSPEFLFRSERGTGEPDALGRVRLSPREIAQAVNYSLREEHDPSLWAAADSGKLETRDQVAAAVRLRLEAPLEKNPRLLAFFRQYFGYPKANEVFKDPPVLGTHDPAMLVGDLDALLRHLLRADRDVLRQMLTTPLAFINWSVDPMDGSPRPARPGLGAGTVYGLPPDWEWTPKQPVALPSERRAGVLTHPAWLTAWSGNFDNDPVRRGKWIRTHLLGGSVPDVPIGVDARIPEDEHLTLRARLRSATSEAACWRCHNQMNPLGLPLERYSHLGYFRDQEKGKPIDSRGRIDRTGDARLDGTAVTDPVAMMRTLATSTRVEQVFVRHVFRFYLGRNETLGDAATLQDAWRAFRTNHGSYKELLVSLLTSDSFLLRKPRP